MLFVRRLVPLSLCCALAAGLGACDGPTNDWPNRSTDDKPGPDESTTGGGNKPPSAPAGFADAGVSVLQPSESDAGDAGADCTPGTDADVPDAEVSDAEVSDAGSSPVEGDGSAEPPYTDGSAAPDSSAGPDCP